MKVIIQCLFVTMLLGFGSINAQTGTCASPKSVSMGTCSATDTFNLAPYYLQFTANTDSSAYPIRLYIQGLSSNPDYSVKVYYADCAHLASSELEFADLRVGDTIYGTIDDVQAGLNYLIEITNNNSSPAPTSYYSLCINEVYRIIARICPSSYANIPPGCDLVCNGSFEFLSSAGTYITSAYGWTNANCGTADLYSTTFSVTAPSNGVPCNKYGYEGAYGGGNNYAGIITYDPTYALFGGSFSEYIETRLISAMNANQVYRISYYISKGENSENYPVDLATFLTNAAITTTTCGPINAYTISNTPVNLVSSAATLSNTTGWTQVAFNYTATGGEQYLTIGPKTASSIPVPLITWSTCSTLTWSPSYMYIDNVSVLSLPYPVTQSPICPETPATFTINCPMSPATYTFDFGDSSPTYTCNTPFATHSYNTAGTYTVILTTSGPSGTYTSMAVQTVTTQTGSFTYTNNCSMGLTTDFAAVATCTTANMYYTWTFGDGGTFTSSSPTIAYTYTGSGTYTPTLTINWGPGVSWTGSQTFTILPTPTVIINSTGGSLCAANSQTFTAVPSPTASYTYSWSAASGTITSGQGTSALGMNLTGLSSTAVITLTITSANSCSTTATYSVFPCCSTDGSVTTFAPNYNFSTSITYTSGVFAFTGSVTISPSVTVEFDGCEIRMNPASSFSVGSSGWLIFGRTWVHACSAMWNGIYPDNGGNVLVESSIVEDAQRVLIDSLGADKIQSLNSIYNKNYKGFVYKTPTTVATYSLHGNAFINADLTSSSISYTLPVNTGATNSPTVYSSLPAINLLPPYSSITSKTGIECVNTTSTSSSYLIVGHDYTAAPIANAYQNLFHHLSEGIAVYNSKVQIWNNYFQYCNVSPNQSGVYVNGSFTAPSDVYVGGTLPNDKCYFDSNVLGVYSYLPATLTVRNCAFGANTTAGVKCYNNCNNKTVTVSSNLFKNAILGVRMQDNYYINATISSNTFSNTTAVGTYATNYGAYITEFASASSSSVAAYNVAANTIVGYYNGIYANKTYSSTITGNVINMRAAPTASNYQQGINVTICDLPQVQTNSVSITSGSTTASWQQGILTSNCTLPSVLCNSVTNLATAVKIEGPNYTSSNGNGYCGNILTGYGYGFWLDAYGEIGDQFSGASMFASDNKWVSGFSYQTYVTNFSNIVATLGAQFYTRSSSQYSINNSSTFSVSPLSCITGSICPLDGTNSTATTNVCGGGGGGSGSSASGGGNGGGDTLGRIASPGSQPAVVQYAQQIANGDLKYPVNNENLQWIDQWQLYQGIQGTDISNHPHAAALNGFKDRMARHSIGHLRKVNDVFSQAVVTGARKALQEAIALNNSVRASNIIEWNQKEINAIYASYLSNGHKLDAMQIGDLERLAVLCPMTNGPSVYQARGMLFDYLHKKYTSDCENIGSDQERLLTAASPGVVSSNGVRIYPNPASNEIIVETGDRDNCELVMFDMLGQQVLHQSLERVSKISVSHLNNGTYFYHIQQSGGSLKRDKLIIVR